MLYIKFRQRLQKILFIPLLIILLSSYTIKVKPPELTPSITKKKMDEILHAHVSYKSLDAPLIKQLIEGYLDTLDPLKAYLIHSEIVEYSSLSDDMCQQIKNDIQKEDFTIFERIYSTMISAITRRNRLEENIPLTPNEKKISLEEFKNSSWAETEEMLTDRLIQLRILQTESCQDNKAREQLVQRITKKRLLKEQELISYSPEFQKKHMLSLILKSFASSLDSYTVYFTPTETQSFIIQVQQRLFGIGAQLRDDLNGFTVVRLLEGSPVEKCGLIKKGDRIIAVNEEPVIGLDIIDAVELIRGPKGSAVTLTFSREHFEKEKLINTEIFNVDVTREEIILNESRFETNVQPFGDGVIAHLRLFSFYQDPNSSSVEDLKKEIQRLDKEHNLLGVILDLRSNPGGLLPQAVAVTGLFVKKGIIASVKGKHEQVQHLRNLHGTVVWNGPLIVLTNRASASASEIVAQSLQDFGRAIIIGDDYTFGKGSYQTFTLEPSINQNIRINPQGEFKVTRGRYYTVSGKSPQFTGTKTDIEVPGILSKLEVGERFTKNPLKNDSIPPNFQDTLSDLSIIQKKRLQKIYLTDLQKPLLMYHPYLDILKKNSQMRIQQNTTYQNFLTNLSESDISESNLESLGQCDLQLEETISIMKDLLILMKTRSKL
ncbi:MAG: S41 family peptidase [Chlamydiales bacterium]